MRPKPPFPTIGKVKLRIHRHRDGFSLVELLVVLAIIGILTGLLLPAIQSSREAARRMSCQNNLRQLGLSLLNFESGYGTFPASGWTQAGPGNPSGAYVGWRALTLPFLEQTNTQKLYDFESHWWEGTNTAVASIQIKVYQCPSVPKHSEVMEAIAKPPRPALHFTNPLAPTDYEAVMGVKPSSLNPHFSQPLYNATNRFSVMHRNSRTKFAHITDGSSNTIMIVECGGRPLVFRGRREMPYLANDQGIGWADSEGPFSLDGARADGSLEGCGPQRGCTNAMNARNDNEPYSFHRSGANFLFADGHVEFISQQIDLKLLAAMCTKAAGEITIATSR